MPRYPRECPVCHTPKTSSDTPFCSRCGSELGELPPLPEPKAEAKGLPLKCPECGAMRPKAVTGSMDFDENGWHTPITLTCAKGHVTVIKRRLSGPSAAKQGEVLVNHHLFD